jgi:hypothetical protein
VSNSKKISSAKDFKKKKAAMELLLPSGETCLARRPGIQAFFAAGIIPNSLMGIMTKAMEGKDIQDATLQKELGNILAEPEKLQEMFHLMDNITIYCVVEPAVRSDRWTNDDVTAGLASKAQVGTVIPHSVRDEELLYIDEVDDDDKNFVFNWAVGGTSDLEQFRVEQNQLMESVSASQVVGRTAKRTGGAKKR